MSGVQDDSVQLISGLLRHIRQIVGDGASYAMLHYGAVEEGKRLAAGYLSDDLPLVLARIDAVLAQQTEVLKDDGGHVTVRVRCSPLVDAGHRSIHGLVVGLLEGSLAASRHGRFRGQVVASDLADSLLVELRREP